MRKQAIASKLEILNKAISNFPFNGGKTELAGLYNERGHCKYLKVDFDDAAIDFTKAIELHPEAKLPYYNRGTIKYRMGCFSQALKDFEKALELDPSNEDFLLALSKCKKEFHTHCNKC